MRFYGSGLRRLATLRLRVKDVDFERLEITVRDGKGAKERRTMLARSLVGPLRERRERVCVFHAQDVHNNAGPVYLSFALERKYPNAGRELAWHYLFPVAQHADDPRSGIMCRHHLGDKAFQRAIMAVVWRAGINKPARRQTLCHSFATQLLEKGYHIRSIQE